MSNRFWNFFSVYLLLLLFFSEVIKDITPGKEKPHAEKPQPAWGTWEL
jgi:hypothetical protein